MSDPDRPYRIAVRAEGASINAYWTRTGTMEGAELVAHIRRDLCVAAPEVFDAFRKMMGLVAVELAFTRLHRSTIAVEITDAPEHERSGSA